MRNSTLPSCNAVADFFLLQVDAVAGDSISNLKLQKLCYYAQAWSLALRDEPIFHDPIEAWAHGPAIPHLYGRFKKYGWQSIDPFDLRTDPLKELSNDDQLLLNRVWASYGGLSGKQLELLTHSEAPWRIARGATPPGERCKERISLTDMKEFYRSQMRSHEDSTSNATRR